jgi:hypothetical protein
VTAADVLAAARRLADDLLFPAALEVDGADLVPRSHLDTLAASGLLGLWARSTPGDWTWTRRPALASPRYSPEAA